MGVKMKFEDNYKSFMIGLLFGIVWLFLILTLTKFLKYDSSQTGILLILCGLTGLYQSIITDILIKKVKK